MESSSEDMIKILMEKIIYMVTAQSKRFFKYSISDSLCSFIHQIIPINVWHKIYDELKKNVDFKNHENGKRYLRWKPTTLEEYHSRIYQCTHYMWIFDENYYKEDREITFFFPNKYES